MDDICLRYTPGSSRHRRIQFHLEEIREDAHQIRVALGGVVCQQLNAVDTHQRQQRVVLLLEGARLVGGLDRGKFPPQYHDEEVAASAGELADRIKLDTTPCWSCATMMG
ncbi:hypothetical protein [Corynebacterium sp. CCM 9204]|uniref:hypothetical protein n=1 Tax=Corynebacterium sp. CCM 9204 TaxID=3057616 RepID=UPI003523F5A1